MAVGKISGPLLSSNLVRDGVNLAVETDLLFLDVNKSRIGINTSSPQFDLDVNGSFRTTHLNVNTALTIGSLTITENSISSSQSAITIAPSGNEPVVYHARIVADNLQIYNNTIQSLSESSNLVISAAPNNVVEINSETVVSGNLRITNNLIVDGDITVGGNIVLGDETTDQIVVNAGFGSDLFPEVTNTYSLGTEFYRWDTIFVDTIDAGSITAASLKVGDLTFEENRISVTHGSTLTIDSSSGVQVGDFLFKDSTILNTSPNSVTEIFHVGTGYLKVGGSNGLVIPRGTTQDRPTGREEVGMIRFNTDLECVEVWQGVEWGTPAGRSGPLTEDRASLIAAAIVLTLG